MKNKIEKIITIFCMILLLCFYVYIGHMCINEEEKHDQEIKRREYIKFQRDSLELELYKKGIK